LNRALLGEIPEKVIRSETRSEQESQTYVQKDAMLDQPACHEMGKCADIVAFDR
jgi:hypothetical protein